MYANNRTLTLPSGEVVWGGQQIIPDGHFFWGEALHSLTRIPANIAIESRIVRTAYSLERVRELLGGKPMLIHSWYRDRATNERLGVAAKDSRHLYGDAIDFSCRHISLRDIYSLLSKLHQSGGLALYPAHIHLDFRGVKARW